MMKRFLSIFVLLTCLSSSVALAGGRSTFSFGPWKGFFSQTGNGFDQRINSRLSLALGFTVGYTFQPLFVEYAASWFWAQHFLRPGGASETNFKKADDAAYWGLLGFNVGLDLPKFPIEPYVGWELGNFGFSTGTSNDFHGNALKLGVVFVLSGSKKKGSGLGIRGEYRHLWGQRDDAGNMPSGISSNISVYMIGLNVTFGGG